MHGISIMNSFSNDYHALEDFKKLTTAQKVATIVVTILASIVTLFIGTVPIFRLMVNHFKVMHPDPEQTRKEHVSGNIPPKPPIRPKKNLPELKMERSNYNLYQPFSRQPEPKVSVVPSPCFKADRPAMVASKPATLNLTQPSSKKPFNSNQFLTAVPKLNNKKQSLIGTDPKLINEDIDLSSHKPHLFAKKTVSFKPSIQPFNRQPGPQVSGVTLPGNNKLNLATILEPKPITFNLTQPSGQKTSLSNTLGPLDFGAKKSHELAGSMFVLAKEGFNKGMIQSLTYYDANQGFKISKKGFEALLQFEGQCIKAEILAKGEPKFAYFIDGEIMREGERHLFRTAFLSKTDVSDTIEIAKLAFKHNMEMKSSFSLKNKENGFLTIEHKEESALPHFKETVDLPNDFLERFRNSPLKPITVKYEPLREKKTEENLKEIAEKSFRLPFKLEESKSVISETQKNEQAFVLEKKLGTLQDSFLGDNERNVSFEDWCELSSINERFSSSKFFSTEDASFIDNLYKRPILKNQEIMS